MYKRSGSICQIAYRNPQKNSADRKRLFLYCGGNCNIIQFLRNASVYFVGLKLSFRLTERLNTRCSGVESLLSGQK